MNRGLFVTPVKEISEYLGLPVGGAMKVVKAAYGLVSAPLERFLAVTEKFSAMGLKVLRADPCCWKLEENGEVVALICAHVGDFLFAGSPTSTAWLACREQIQKEFQWGEWETG
eukprot:5220501-Alexandrium_andersonii.AAC.1